jgi:hypothetical protein
MLRIEEREGPPQIATVRVMDEGLIPFKIYLSPYDPSLRITAPWYWRPHKGPWQIFEVKALTHNGPLAALNCISLAEGARLFKHAMPSVEARHPATATVCVVSETLWCPMKETADPGPEPEPLKWPWQQDEPIGVTVDIFQDGIRATWLKEAPVAEGLQLAGGVSLLLDSRSLLVGVEIEGVSKSDHNALLSKFESC